MQPEANCTYSLIFWQTFVQFFW